MGYQTIKQDGTLYTLVPVAEAPQKTAPGAKPGWKTTEFWKALLPQAAGLLAATGVLTPEQADAVTQAAIQVVGLAAMVAASFGYSLSRGRAKGRG
jgi:hypothetical protein